MKKSSKKIESDTISEMSNRQIDDIHSGDKVPALPEGKEVLFQPMGRRVANESRQTILELALQYGIGIEATCGGKGICGKCRVKPTGKTTPPSSQELDLLGQETGSHRLACQTWLLHGGMVWIPEESRSRQQIILTTGQQVELQLDPVLQIHNLEFEPPSLNNPQALDGLLLKCLGEKPDSCELPLSILQSLPIVFREKSRQITAVSRLGKEIIYITPGREVQCLGLAVDLGTTTVVAYLFDLLTGQSLAVEADMNPQVNRGDDVISRIAHCQERPDGLRGLGMQIMDCINLLARKACSTAGVKPENIMDCVMVGNTAMHHIFLGLDPIILSKAPYAPVTRSGTDLKAREVGLKFAEESWIHWLPVKAGFVGADTVAVALAVKADKATEPTLILDLGTNGEMILAVPGAMVCCSTAAGPAFEGGHIAYGMRAGAGAVERVILDPTSLGCELSVIGNGKPIGLCGSGLVSLISQLAAAGVIMPGGSFNPEMVGSRLRSGANGLEYVIAFADQCGLGRDLVLTSQDVAEIQLAKGAIRAGVEIMMLELGVKSLGEVVLAGAFGNYLDPESAKSLGLFPVPEQNNIRGVGNAAGTGAIMAMVSFKEREHANYLAHHMHYIELTTHAKFQELFVDWMVFH